MLATKAREVVQLLPSAGRSTPKSLECTTRTFLSAPMRDVHAHLTRLDGAKRDDRRLDDAGNLRGVTRLVSDCAPGCSSARISILFRRPARSTACSASCSPWRS